MMLYYSILTLVAGSAFLLASSLLQLRRKPRLRFLTEEAPPIQQFSFSSIKFFKPLVISLQPIINLPYFKAIQEQAEILKINLDVPALLLIKLSLSAVAGILVFKISSSAGYALAAVLAGFLIPDFLFFSKVKAKKEAIIRAFPETVDLIDLCIGAGLDFSASIKWVIDKSDTNPFIGQLETVLKEIRVGRNRTDALKGMAKRLRIPDISSFVRTVVQSERMGTSIEEAFKNLSEDTRLSRYQAGERYAIKASLKILFPLLFCILPVILIVVGGPIIIKFTSGELIPKTGAGF